jgi:tetratricopeptide (TPR) repeat protein
MKIRNPKSEIRNKLKIRIKKIWILNIGNCFGFRISDFGFLGRSLVIVLALVAGCMSTGKPVKTPVGNNGRQVKVGGDSVQLGEVQKPVLTPDGFAQRIDDLLAAQKQNSARCLVQRYPDVALDLLRGATSRQGGSPALKAIAKLYDEQCCHVDANAGWAALIKDLAERSDHYSTHDIERKKLLDDLRDSRAKEATEIHLTATVKGAPGVAMEVDALQLQGEALMQAGRPKDAVATLTAAHKLAKSAFPQYSVRLLLLLSDAQRRDANYTQAAATWKEVAELAVSLTRGPHPVTDPGLWERLAYLRPVTSTWPAETNEAQVWHQIGQWRLRRSEPQGALLAFKHGEAFATDKPMRDRLQVGEARALAELGQRASALAILNHLADPAKSDQAQQAFAVLGSLLFNEGQTAEAKAALHKAVDGGKDWPGRAEAEADLALACLSTSDEAEGMEHLHHAQKQLEAACEYELLQQCMWNEAAYLDHVSKRDEANAVRQRARKLEMD